MSEWLYSLHPPRENFAATMTDDEVAAWNLHFKWLGGLLQDGHLVLAGATLGTMNTGIAVIEAPDDATARRIVSEDPAVTDDRTRAALGRQKEVRVLAMLMIEYKLPTSAVPDFADWKQVFDTDPVGRKAHGATRHWIYQDPNDTNHFLLSIEFRSIDEANGFLNEPMLRRSWEASGARQAWVLAETEAVTY